MKKFPVPAKIKKFSSIFREEGFSLYIVGGAVRDYLLGIKNHDYDFCTDAEPQEVMKIFPHVIPTGIKHGTVTVLFGSDSYEVTTFRTEGAYSDSRHPDSVKFVRSLEEDLSRRDFTVNAFAADCVSGEITDLFGGYDDLKKGLIRAIGNPGERFLEDALRLLRMCRFCAKLNFMPEEKTMYSATELCENINAVSSERIFDEIRKTLMTDHPSTGFSLMEITGLLNEILPELAACRTIQQTKVNANDVFEHIMISVNAAAEHDYPEIVRIALLLHDIGKVKTMSINQYGIMRFHGHEIEGARMAEAVLRRLKCSNYIVDTAKLLIENHMIRYTSSWTDGAVRRFINRIGKENIELLFEVQWCDQIASEGRAKVELYDEFISRIREVQKTALTVKDLKVNGEDLNRAGIPRSREMGIVLNELLEMVLDYPSLNDREVLLKEALIIYQNLTAPRQA
ncbi:MAG: CCA tRNA nucleotidyltransferase [Sphaerochaetaceae bacterium]|nr:CCA tRNA nucleotidyltransferase [Sphaerochaetaceae bacterium]